MILERQRVLAKERREQERRGQERDFCNALHLEAVNGRSEKGWAG
jgi:hypothetical protein